MSIARTHVGRLGHSAGTHYDRLERLVDPLLRIVLVPAINNYTTELSIHFVLATNGHFSDKIFYITPHFLVAMVMVLVQVFFEIGILVLIICQTKW